MILIEITAAINSGGTTQTFYLSDGRFVSGASDTPAHTAFDPRIIDPGTIGVHAYADGATGGATKLELGEITLANADGGLDAWVNYSFDGRPVTIRLGTTGAYPSAFPAVLTCTVASIEAKFKTITVRLKDKSFLFDKPYLTTFYAGNNALPAGLEGTDSDIGGKPKPDIHGKVFEISPPCVNTSKLTYQVRDGAVASIDAVYDSALALTPGTNYATSALLQAAATAAGTYDTCIAEGYLRLGSTPAGPVTADVTQGAAAANRTVAQVLKQLALDAGVSSGEISSADVTALDGINSAVVGIFISDASTTVQQAMDEVAASIGAWYGFDTSGTLRMGVLTAPSGAAVVTLYDYDLGNDLERRPGANEGIPVWSVTINHTKLWTVQTSGLAGAVTAAHRAYVGSEYRSKTSTDSSVKTQFLLAGTRTVDGLLTSATDAGTEATRQLTLFKARRDFYDAPVQASIVTTNSLKLMDVVALDFNRFSMTGGRSFRVLGFDYQLAKQTVTLNLWG